MIRPPCKRESAPGKVRSLKESAVQQDRARLRECAPVGKAPISSFTHWFARHPCPASGSGVHRWLLSASRAALRGGIASADAEGAMLAAMTRPPNSRTEIRDTLRKAGMAASHRANVHRPRWPTSAPRTTAEHYAALGRERGVVELADAWEQSPVRLLDDEPLTEAIIARLFGSDELLCCACGVEHAVTRPAGEFAGKLHGFTHLVPSPMSALTGVTQEGRESCRCLASTGPRKFLVIEFDREPRLDRQAQLHFGLARHAPLVLVVFSGKKSLHGWFHVEGWPEAEAQKLHRLAVACGADAATWTRCQLVRMPDAMRPDTGQRQSVYFWNPKYAEASR
jgi:hypothetical protein